MHSFSMQSFARRLLHHSHQTVSNLYKTSGSKVYNTAPFNQNKTLNEKYIYIYIFKVVKSYRVTSSGDQLHGDSLLWYTKDMHIVVIPDAFTAAYVSMATVQSAGGGRK